MFVFARGSFQARRVCGSAARAGAMRRWYGPPPPSSAGEKGGAGVDGISAFLADLLEPPRTVPLVCGTRVYDTMDVDDARAVYDPGEEGETSATASDNAPDENDENDEDEAVFYRRAHAAGALWRHCASSTAEERAANRPPRWFERLCRDLFFRTDDDDDGGGGSARGEGGPAPANDAAVDPFAWLPFELRAEAAYGVAPYVFAASAGYSAAARRRLCLGRPRRAYVHFCDAYAFPGREQIPTSVGTIPARLLFDPRAPAAAVLVQLSPDFPPAGWLAVRPTAAALRRVLGAFARAAVRHRDAHHAEFARRQAEALRVMALQRMPSSSSSSSCLSSSPSYTAGEVLRMMAAEARAVPFPAAPARPSAAGQTLFLGEHAGPEGLLGRLDRSPFLFAIAASRAVVGADALAGAAAIDGPGVAASAFRARFSKAVVRAEVVLAAGVGLPAQDPDGLRRLWRGAQVAPRARVPVFARLSWPDDDQAAENGERNGQNEEARRAGTWEGTWGPLARRLNRLLGTEFAWGAPVDAVLAVVEAAGGEVLGVRGLRARLAALEAAASRPRAARLYPATREIPNPEFSLEERIGMHVQYLAYVGDPDIAATIARMRFHAAPVRAGCAKAALIAGERALFREIVASEPDGRLQRYLTTLVRKRKTRDLTSAEPMLLEEQFEFAAPLWTKRGGRLDRNTLEGALDAARLQR